METQIKKFTVTFLDTHNWKGKIIIVYGETLKEALKKNGWGCDEVFSMISDVKQD